MKDGLGQLNVAKVTRALGHAACTGLAAGGPVNDPLAGVHETPQLGSTTLVDLGVLDAPIRHRHAALESNTAGKAIGNSASSVKAKPARPSSARLKTHRPFSLSGTKSTHKPLFTLWGQEHPHWVQNQHLDEGTRGANRSGFGRRIKRSHFSCAGLTAMVIKPTRCSVMLYAPNGTLSHLCE